MHCCPICGEACYCSGDIEDHDTGDEYLDRCTHPEQCDDNDDYDDDLDDWGDDVDDEDEMHA